MPSYYYLKWQSFLLGNAPFLQKIIILIIIKIKEQKKISTVFFSCSPIWHQKMENMSYPAQPRPVSRNLENMSDQDAIEQRVSELWLALEGGKSNTNFTAGKRCDLSQVVVSRRAAGEAYVNRAQVYSVLHDTNAVLD